MPNEQIYTTELERFRKKYNMPEYSLDAVMAINQKLQYLNNFLTNDALGNNSASQFISAVSRTLSMYFEVNTKLRADGKYMSGFYPQDFLRDFEKLASAKYYSELNEGEQPQRKKFEGAKKRDIKKILINNFKDLNKTLPTLWMEKLKNGSMTQNEMLLATGNVMDALESSMPENKIGLEDKVSNVVAAHEAMKQLRASRSGFLGWLWKIIFRERNEIEETNLRTFESQVNRLRTEGYPVDKIAEDLTGKTVLGLDVLVEKQAKETATAKNQENPVKQAFQPIKVEPCAEKMRNAYPETSKKVIKEIVDKLPVTNKFGGLFREQTLELIIGSRVFEKFDELNVQFDKDMQNGNQKNAIAKLVRESFMVAQSVSVMATSGVEMNKVDACAIIAKLFIDNFTAVSIYPELNGIVNEYIKDNAALYNEIDAKELSYSNEIDKYAVDYVPNEKYFREPVFGGENNPFVENNAEISSPVVQQPQKDVPTLNNK